MEAPFGGREEMKTEAEILEMIEKLKRYRRPEDDANPMGTAISALEWVVA